MEIFVSCSPKSGYINDIIFLLSPQVKVSWPPCLVNCPPRLAWYIERHTQTSLESTQTHQLLTLGVCEGWQLPIWTAMLLGREEEEMKSWGEDSSTGKWPSTVRESWGVEHYHSDDLHSWRGYDSTRYVYVHTHTHLLIYKVHLRTTTHNFFLKECMCS